MLYLVTKQSKQLTGLVLVLRERPENVSALLAVVLDERELRKHARRPRDHAVRPVEGYFHFKFPAR